jgi:hypothetical protein
MWACGNSSPITSGLLSYGVLWIKTGNFAPWKWFMGECCPHERLLTPFPFHLLREPNDVWKADIGTTKVITGSITIVYGVAVWFFFPDSPLHANFLTPEERAQAILRIKENHSGIENKRFKRHQ